MTVKELIEALSGLDPDLLVVLSGDGEGNDYSPYGAYGTGYYVPDSTYSGELWHPQDEEHEDCYDGDPDDDKEYNAHIRVCVAEPPEPPEGAVPCVVLWPTN